MKTHTELKGKKNIFKRRFASFSFWVTKATGSSAAFFSALHRICFSFFRDLAIGYKYSNLKTKIPSLLN